MSEKQLDQFINNIAKTGVNPISMLGYASLSRELKAALQCRVQHQEEVLRVMTVLPGKYRYEQVDAAIDASGASPKAIYWLLAANDRTEVLARFYEALNGSGGNDEGL